MNDIEDMMCVAEYTYRQMKKKEAKKRKESLLRKFEILTIDVVLIFCLILIVQTIISPTLWKGIFIGAISILIVRFSGEIISIIKGD